MLADDVTLYRRTAVCDSGEEMDAWYEADHQATRNAELGEKMAEAVKERGGGWRGEMERFALNTPFTVASMLCRVYLDWSEEE